MKYRNLNNTDLSISAIALGTWAFGSDRWWGYQDDNWSYEVLDAGFEKGITLIDTAPVYGRGHSEEIIGRFLKKRGLREKVILATKLGLSWEERRIYHNLKPKRMLEEIDASRKRLNTDYFDLYQVHWPDPDTPIAETASVMNNFYKKGIIKTVGVSNYRVEQMREFMNYCPLHSSQPPYNMFNREIEKDIVPFCKENNIAILAYIPLNSGILTGKFFFEGVKIPNDLCRKNHSDLKEPFFSINKHILEGLKRIAEQYDKSLTQLVLNWTANRDGITSILAGARNRAQLQDNAASLDWEIRPVDLEKIEELLSSRDEMVRLVKK
ncbi:MAG: aldo/keto reductase [Candidatus Omnitrophica bacterium]|nr:aldo/keto reductase [Candidatus Omnitrophota bacterium]